MSAAALGLASRVPSLTTARVSANTQPCRVSSARFSTSSRRLAAVPSTVRSSRFARRQAAFPVRAAKTEQTESESESSIQEQAKAIAEDKFNDAKALATDTFKDFTDIVARTNLDDMQPITRNEVLAMEKEMVIGTHRDRIINLLSSLIVNESDKAEFDKLCTRVAAVIRAWYNLRFDRLMERYSYFDPVGGKQRVKSERLSEEQVNRMEAEVLREVVALLQKSNYKPISLEEYKIATSCSYLINLPIDVNKKKLDSGLFERFYESGGVDLKPEELPDNGKHYLLFRRGVGVDKTTDLFIDPKIDVLISRLWLFALTRLGLKQPEEPAPRDTSVTQLAQQLQEEAKKAKVERGSVDSSDDEDAGENDPLVAKRRDAAGKIHYERIRLENLPVKDLIGLTTIQEPTFERVIVVYRPTSGKKVKPGKLGDRTIEFKQFKSIPMADIEMVLPEKKNPGLTPKDTVNYLVSAVGGLTALFLSFELKNFDLAVAYTISAAVFAYFSKLYSAYQSKMAAYNQAMMNAMYAKQLDSGNGTLLNIFHQVIEQEVKEVIISFYILMTQGKATLQELDERCEDLMASEFSEQLDFDVADACNKLTALGLVTKDSAGFYSPVSLKRANEMIGVTTEEIMTKVVPA
ncbi:hypothetical protein CLOM_g19023 [Closterium sp. NIES-68]|nr:hypothetical protein CLOM_g19023 [Closterium sp. NIES-68]GJP65906.1 hypothetical protein CLOP_g22807 [Closterium sp. NIES-67]